MPNRLRESSSPYLRQHADNPVDWLPWGEEAFEIAEREGKPIFLSVGYSSCHWCHVMAHESFEDAEVAEVLNRDFVSIKVDREERPDVDEAYMTFIQLISGRGGWPMSVFLTPDRRPFFGGTYWPKADRGGHYGFLSLTRQIAEAWREKRPEIEASASQYSEALREALTTPSPQSAARLDHELYLKAVRQQAHDFDRHHGGFGGAPKFPPHSSLEFLMGYALADGLDDEVRGECLGMALGTLERMALGGIHDHVGGGFHRYSTDSEWLLPHFEKMLYDNALMLSNFARAAGLAARVEPRLSPLFERTANGIVGWLAREMTSPDGTFYSALDADSEGEEGRFYVWKTDEVAELPAALDFVEAFGLRPEGNFADEATGQLSGANILHLTADAEGTFDAQLTRLLDIRSQRVRPELDNKVIVAWNGLMIAALTDAGLVEMAARAANAILEHEATHGRLPHQILDGVPSGEAYLDDYAAFALALTKLARLQDYLSSVGEAALGRDAGAWMDVAIRLGDEMVERFYDEVGGGFFGVSDNHETLFGRTKPVFDQPIPSANSLAIRVLTEIGDDLRAMRSLQALIGWMERAPQATEGLFTAGLAYLMPDSAPTEAPPSEIVVILESARLEAADDGTATGAVTLSIPSGMHINTNTPAARWLTPTALKIEPQGAVVAYPLGDEFENYTGEVRIPFTVRLDANERGAEFEVTLTYQPCTESECLLPVERRWSLVVERP